MNGDPQVSTLERETDAAQTLPRQTVLRRAWAAYPVHPPLTHLTIGAYTTASLLAVPGTLS